MNLIGIKFLITNYLKLLMKNSTNILLKYLSILICLTILTPSNLLGNDNIRLKCKTKTFQSEIPTIFILEIIDRKLKSFKYEKGKPMEIISQNIDNNIIYFYLKAYEGYRFDLDLSSNSFASDMHLPGLCDEI